MMKYEEAIQYLFTQLPMYQRIGKQAFKKDLGNIRLLLEGLGNPERSFPSIHIAGTNGKGSVSHLLAAIFQAHGFRVGLYTSPHYTDFRERIKINGELIPRRTVSSFVARYRESWKEIKPSFFEMTVALAFTCFAREKVDLAIIETGLGGRLDSTNVIMPLLSVITNIDFDHMDMLGDTLPLIAAEKGGIIKQGVPVVIGQKRPETEQVFINRAEEMLAPLHFAEDIASVSGGSRQGEYQHFDCRVNGEFSGRAISTDLLGPFQGENIRTALASVAVFRKACRDWDLPWEITLNALSSVISSTYFIGRWQYIGKQPDILIDSGHNVHALKAIVGYLGQRSMAHVHCVIGFSAGKEVRAILSLLPRDSILYIAKPDVPRGMHARAVWEEARQLGFDAGIYPSVRAAYKSACKKAGMKDLVFVGGSVFVVAEVLAEEGY